MLLKRHYYPIWSINIYSSLYLIPYWIFPRRKPSAKYTWYTKYLILTFRYKKNGINSRNTDIIIDVLPLASRWLRPLRFITMISATRWRLNDAMDSGRPSNHDSVNVKFNSIVLMHTHTHQSQRWLFIQRRRGVHHRRPQPKIEPIGNHWKPLGTIGNHWKPLGTIGNHWEPSAYALHMHKLIISHHRRGWMVVEGCIDVVAFNIVVELIIQRSSLVE